MQTIRKSMFPLSALTLSLLCNTSLHAEPINSPIPELAALESLTRKTTRLLRYSPIESAGSHGSYGWTVAVSALQTQHGGDADSKPYRHTRLHLIRGTSWPMDLGLSWGILNEQGQMTGTGYVQGTVFEEFRLPALSIRGWASQIIDSEDIPIQSHGLDLIGSYALLPLLRIFCGVGNQTSTNRLVVDDRQMKAMKFFETHSIVGIQIPLLASGLQVSGEASFREGRWDSSLRIAALL